MRLVLCLSLVALICSGCAQIGTRTVKLSNSFDPAEVSHIHKTDNTVKGSAVIRTSGGRTVNSAGVEVHLLPVTPYASERITAIYGNSERGYSTQKIKFDPPAPQAYSDSYRVAVGDAQGFFQFENVADGSYYVTTRIMWTPGKYISVGGALMQRVTVSGGETITIVLAP